MRTFSELTSHYLFAVRFRATGEKGNGKDKVEGPVGYARRNIQVPTRGRKASLSRMRGCYSVAGAGGLTAYVVTRRYCLQPPRLRVMSGLASARTSF
jgi:hypothetical protein